MRDDPAPCPGVPRGHLRRQPHDGDRLLPGRWSRRTGRHHLPDGDDAWSGSRRPRGLSWSAGLTTIDVPAAGSHLGPALNTTRSRVARLVFGSHVAGSTGVPGNTWNGATGVSVDGPTREPGPWSCARPALLRRPWLTSVFPCDGRTARHGRPNGPKPGRSASTWEEPLSSTTSSSVWGVRTGANETSPPR